jgi:hypothetical protein
MGITAGASLLFIGKPKRMKVSTTEYVEMSKITAAESNKPGVGADYNLGT